MKREVSGQHLSAVFVDYDNIYLSLKRKSEEAAKRFAKDASVWLKEIETGALITATNSPSDGQRRRLVMNRCYGNPVPRRNASDNSTDMNSFPFVRHHFLRSGFEVVDCPPLTAQLKNSSDIRMVMDVRDFLTHETHFDEFIILSGDADFTPLLHRLRAHARRTVIFANDYTAAPYTAICDGEVREADLIAVLTGTRAGIETDRRDAPQIADAGRIDAIRREIVAEIIGAVRTATNPVPLEALADRLIRTLGHEKTIATSWAGAGSFRDLLVQSLPPEVRISDQPPYVCYEVARQAATPVQVQAAAQPQPQRVAQPAPTQVARAPMAQAPMAQPQQPAAQLAARPIAPVRQPVEQLQPQPAPAQPAPVVAQQPAQQVAPVARPGLAPSAVQQSIARIHEACQAPPLAPPEYRLLFEIMAAEITNNGLAGTQTITNILSRGQESGLEIGREDVRFVLEVVSEADPWFEQGASANLFAGRFRNFVVARCRSQGLSLSADELDLVEAWFAGAPAAQSAPAPAAAPAQQRAPAHHVPVAAQQMAPEPRLDRRWTLDEGRQHVAGQRQATVQQAHAAPINDGAHGEEFPRILRTRLRS